MVRLVSAGAKLQHHQQHMGHVGVAWCGDAHMIDLSRLSVAHETYIHVERHARGATNELSSLHYVRITYLVPRHKKVHTVVRDGAIFDVEVGWPMTDWRGWRRQAGRWLPLVAGELRAKETNRGTLDRAAGGGCGTTPPPHENRDQRRSRSRVSVFLFPDFYFPAASTAVYRSSTQYGSSTSRFPLSRTFADGLRL